MPPKKAAAGGSGKNAGKGGKDAGGKGGKDADKDSKDKKGGTTVKVSCDFVLFFVLKLFKKILFTFSGSSYFV